MKKNDDFVYIRTRVMSFDDVANDNGDVFDKSDLKFAFTDIPKEIMTKLFIPKEKVSLDGMAIFNEFRRDNLSYAMGIVQDTHVTNDGVEVLMASNKEKLEELTQRIGSKNWKASMSCVIDPSSGDVSSVELGISSRRGVIRKNR